MYKIIGADQREYGPVTVDQIRHWISEGRLNAQSRIKPEGEPDWRTVGSLPEFAESLGEAPGAPPPMAQPGATPLSADSTREAASAAVKGPAIGLAVIAGLAMVLEVSNLVLMRANRDFIRHLIEQYQDPRLREMMNRALTTSTGPVGLFQIGWHLSVELLILIGAIKMLSLRNYQLAFAASILAMLPCVTSSCCCVLGLPFGIWALVVLNRPGVKSHFS